MQRRTLLAALGGTLAVTLTGCMSDPDPNTPTEDSSPNPAAREADLETTIDETPCPSFNEAADKTVCSNSADSDDAPVLLEPPQPPIYEPGAGEEAFAITLRNQADDSFGFNPYGWALKRRTEDGWTHVAPDATPEPWTVLDPGSTYSYELALDAESTTTDQADRVIQHAFETGVYALVIDGTFERDGDGNRVECVAIFGVEESGSN